MISLDCNTIYSMEPIVPSVIIHNDQIIENSPISSYSSFSLSEKGSQFDKQKRRLRFEVILEAATAITQKLEESAVTYLNRGQLYGIQMKDKNASDETITSILSIDFHSASHRMIADNYWTYWITQQKQAKPRTIDLDASRSRGISDLSFSSFNEIRFNWNGKEGCKIFIRFRCLSTDFSRIKGVKGIPLRAQVESFIEGTSIQESCFCKVKLFRDKGAERKYKDDYKQIARQLEKIYGSASEESLQLMYNPSLPYSIFGEIPVPSTVDTFEHAFVEDFTLPSLPLKPTKITRSHKRSKDSVSTNSQSTQSMVTSTTSESAVSPTFQEHSVSKPVTSIITLDGNSSNSDYFSQSNIDTLQDMEYFLPNTHPVSGDSFHSEMPKINNSGFYPPSQNALTTPDLISDLVFSSSTPSIYDVFTPEELQHHDDLFTTSAYSRQDYFCDTYSSNHHFSVLQQKLDFHNKAAADMILNSNARMQLTSKRKGNASHYTTDIKRQHTLELTMI